MESKDRMKTKTKDFSPASFIARMDAVVRVHYPADKESHLPDIEEQHYARELVELINTHRVQTGSVLQQHQQADYLHKRWLEKYKDWKHGPFDPAELTHPFYQVFQQLHVNTQFRIINIIFLTNLIQHATKQ